MRILVAPDKFKGTLSAPEAAALMARLLADALPDHSFIPFPLADGGEGTLEVLTGPLHMEEVVVHVPDPLGREIPAAFGLSRERRLALVEMARASGLQLLDPRELDPLRTSTFGTGRLVLEAARTGAREVLVALGGSATVDGGLGFLQALGARFTPATTSFPFPGGGALEHVREVDLAPVRHALAGVRLAGLCDVTLPLRGPSGAALFMAQKGAAPPTALRLEEGLVSFERVLSGACGRDLAGVEGTGAAGGLGLAILALGGTLESGFERLARLVGLEDRIAACDAVVTGEGSLDPGSRGGKTPVGLARIAKKIGKPCYAVCGSIQGKPEDWETEGFTRVESLFERPMPAGDPLLAETGKRMGEAVARLAQQMKLQEPK